MALLIISAVFSSSWEGVRVYCLQIDIISSGARTRIPSRILLPSSQCAAVESLVLDRISEMSWGSALLVVVEADAASLLSR